MQPRMDPKLVNSWIALCKSEQGTADYEANFWAFDAWFDMQEDVDAVWWFVLAVVAKDQSNRVMEQTAAGPLENLLADHGEKVIDRVEREAKSNPNFARLLGGVWQSDTPPHLWQRVEAVWDRRGWDGIPAA